MTPIQTVRHFVSSDQRKIASGHAGAVIWLTGLPGAGKSTIAMELEQRLFAQGVRVLALDGDYLRMGLNSDLGFSLRDRSENVRRTGEVSHLLARAGFLVIVALISPCRADRDRVRTMGPRHFHEVYLSTPLAECERRDPKGHYAKARAGLIKDFTGVSSPYDRPEYPEQIIDTSCLSIDDSVSILVDYVYRVVDFSGPKNREIISV